MQKGKLIGQGYTAEVYTWGDSEILKLFRKEFPYGGIEKEYSVSKRVEELGLPVPKVGELAEVEDRTGIIYERIYGTPMMVRLFMKPWSIKRDAVRMAEIHFRLHQCKVEGLPKLKDALQWNIKATELISEGKKLNLLQRLEQLPDGDILCHNDYHPGNIIVDRTRETVLDWMTATSGNAAADVSRTLLLLKDAVLPKGTPWFVHIIHKPIRAIFTKAYLRRYLELSGIPIEAIEQWRVLIAAARLMEWIPEKEKNFILNLINKSID